MHQARARRQGRGRDGPRALHVDARVVHPVGGVDDDVGAGGGHRAADRGGVAHVELRDRDAVYLPNPPPGPGAPSSLPR